MNLFLKIPKNCYLYFNLNSVLLGKFSTTMTPSDREALVGTYELAKLLSSIRQIQQEKEEANLKIEFVKRKMEQKAQEEAAEK